LDVRTAIAMPAMEKNSMRENSASTQRADREKGGKKK